ncbi:hypothetical protein L585_08745 [Pantoea ananatis BRT175]|uniref:DUF6387 family protein n=1 Tax=Pantoea ananas TaxID=553 RepID=UPI0003B21870|nr:DUF6387 family protein [Pantoea ananatis]ERM14392.1 hypothetical protein L585_08745 [Pantoea ananatis BRT175]
MIRATKKDLAWFDIDSYEFINEITLLNFVEELEWRDFLYRNVSDDSLIFQEEYDIKYNRIFNGDPNLTTLNKDEKEIDDFVNKVNSESPSLLNDYGCLPQIDSSEGVSPISFSELSMYSYAAEKQGFIKNDEDNTYLRTDAMLASVAGNLDDCFSGSVLASINLDDATDEEILASLSRLLPLWRHQLALPEREHLAQKKIGLKTLQKLISNRVIPILDLIIWGSRFGKEVSNPMISALVFSDDPKDTQAIKESIRPFAIEAMSEQYTRLLRLYINKDREMETTRITDLMGRVL